MLARRGLCVDIVSFALGLDLSYIDGAEVHREMIIYSKRCSLS